MTFPNALRRTARFCEPRLNNSEAAAGGWVVLRWLVLLLLAGCGSHGRGRLWCRRDHDGEEGDVGHAAEHGECAEQGADDAADVAGLCGAAAGGIHVAAVHFFEVARP